MLHRGSEYLDDFAGNLQELWHVANISVLHVQWFLLYYCVYLTQLGKSV